MAIYPDPLNLHLYVEDINTPGGGAYARKFNPFHIRDGAWESRILADRPMDSANYGSASPFKRKDTGGTHVIASQSWFASTGDSTITMENEPSPDYIDIPNSAGGGSSRVIERVSDPAGSGNMVWKCEWDRTKLWASGAANATASGRRRREFRTSNAQNNLVPYGTEMWGIQAVRLDSAIDWASVTAGDYVHWYQWHDTSYNNDHKPSIAGYICAPNTQRSGDYPDPPPNNWFMLHEILNNNEQAILRYVHEKPPTNTWIYTVFNLRMGTQSPFVKLWECIEGARPRLVIDYTGPYGYTDDYGTDFITCGPYSPGLYLGTVPIIRYWMYGTVRFRASDVPGMTPERMIACLKKQGKF